eukprot:GHUV01036306.1.p1 GENE.GHUV01036306.1~~GHUV01036306.1.p1  ORF type:complete len:328 (+),score=87.09 GHUV01036306.1:1642-2625(+)
MLQVGMRLFLMAGMFQHKPLGQLQVFPLAAAYIGYIVLCNLSLNVNTVGFYQVMKIAVAPTVMLLELLFFRVVPPAKVVASVFVVCLGIAIATVTDSKLISNLLGLAVGAAATFVTALYQIWAGSKQKELQASSMQLLHAYTPQAAVILLLMIPIMEPMGWGGQDPNTLLGYKYTPAAVVAIVVSSLLGILVSLSTFLVIGATSSLTYNVVGHLKTVIILTGGCLFFGDEMPPKKLLGVSVAMAGIVWYTHLKLHPSKPSAAKPLLVDDSGRMSTGLWESDSCAQEQHVIENASGPHPSPALTEKPTSAEVSLFMPPLVGMVQRPNR